MPVKTNGRRGGEMRDAIVRPVIMGELPTRLIIPMLIEEIKFNRIPSRKIRERGPRARARALREKNNSKSYNSVAISRPLGPPRGGDDGRYPASSVTIVVDNNAYREFIRMENLPMPMPRARR